MPLKKTLFAASLNHNNLQHLKIALPLTFKKRIFAGLPEKFVEQTVNFFEEFWKLFVEDTVTILRLPETFSGDTLNF